MITQKVDLGDDVLGFTHTWVNKLAQRVDRLHVLALPVGRHELAENVELYSIGKEREAGKFVNSNSLKGGHPMEKVSSLWHGFWGNEWKPLLAVLLLAFALRAGVVFIFRDSILIYTEAAEQFAINFVNGKGFGLIEGLPSSYRPPMYAFFLIIVYGIFGRSALSVGLSQAMVGTGTCFLVYMIGRKIFNHRVGLVAALLVGIYPYLVYHDVHVNRTVVITFLLAAAILLILKVGERPTRWNILLAGVLIAADALAQPTILAAFPFIALWLLVRYDCRFWAALKVSAGIIAATTLALSPWMVRNYLVHHTTVLVSTEVGRNFWKQHNDYTEQLIRQNLWIDNVPEPDDAPGLGVEGAWSQGMTELTISEVELDRWYMAKGWKWVKNNPDGMLRLMWLNLINFWNVRINPYHELAIGGRLSFVASLKESVYTISYGFVLVWAIVGVILARNRRGRVLLLLLLFLGYTLIHMVFVGITRYRMPLDPLLCVLAANGVLVLGQKVLASKSGLLKWPFMNHESVDDHPEGGPGR